MHFSAFALTATAGLFTMAVSQMIDPNSVPISLRNQWCTSQLAACPLICTQETDGSAATISNDCDAETLSFSCVCDNGLSPNSSEYSQTIPYYQCTQSNENCVANCGISNSACASSCREDHPCGAQEPTRVNTTSSASGTATATGADETGTAVFTGFGSEASETGSSSSSDSQSSGAGPAIVNLGQMYGLGVAAAGIFAGFAVLL